MSHFNPIHWRLLGIVLLAISIASCASNNQTETPTFDVNAISPAYASRHSASLNNSHTKSNLYTHIPFQTNAGRPGTKSSLAG